MKRTELSPEHQFILETAVVIDDPKKLMELWKENLNWKEIFFQAVTHRTLNMIRYNLIRFGLYSELDTEYKRVMDATWESNNQKNLEYKKYLKIILNKFKKDGLVVPILKGNVLAYHVYPSPAARIFNDMDFLIKYEDISKVTDSLNSLGLVQGDYNKEKGIIEEISRKKIMMHQLSTHELAEFKMTNDNSFAPVINVDINHSILWKGNCPYEIPSEDLINRAVNVEFDDVQGHMLHMFDNIIQLSCHLFKEATLMLWITDLRDLKIYKFSDLYMYLHSFGNSIDWNKFMERIEEYKLQKIIYYNFYYIEKMFGQIVPEEVMKRLKPNNLDYLNQYGLENQEPATWTLGFFERLFDRDRVLTIEEEQCSKMKSFMNKRMEGVKSAN